MKHLIKVMPAEHLRYSPDKQGKTKQATSPGHYDALIDELYPEVWAVRAGRNKWCMCASTISIYIFINRNFIFITC